MSNPIDELVDGLRVKRAANEKDMADTAVLVYDEPAVSAIPSRRALVISTILGALVVTPFAWAFGYAQHPDAVRVGPPVVTRTVTVEKPVERKSYPDSCTKAMYLIRQTLPDQAAIVSAANPQLDVLDESYRAIMAGDVHKLNAASEKQRKLHSDLSDHTGAVLRNKDQIMQLIGQCEKDLS
jgi:hypothetical protein